MTDRSFLKFAVLHHENIPVGDLISIAQVTVPSNIVRRAGKSAERYRSYWSARVALKLLLGSDAPSYSVIPDPAFGFPKIVWNGAKSWPFCYVSLAHTEGYSVAAIASAPVGIDLEKKNRDASKVMRRVCLEKELELSQHLFEVDGEPIAGSLAIWTIKEAFSKALGLGMKFGFQGFELNEIEKTVIGLKTGLQGPMKLSDPAGQLFLEKNLLVSLVSERSLLGSGAIRSHFSGDDLLTVR